MMNAPHPIDQFKKFKYEITRFMMIYKFALDQMETKIEVLKEEFQSLHDYSPIEHTKSRLKSPESIMNKMFRKNHELTFESIKKNIKDIAGVRITCSFISDIYRIKDMLCNQSDLRVLEVKDYIQNPKPNGYQSLHLLVDVPVYMSNGEERACVEIQIRTIAMDFWASLEHKIFYKYNKDVPERLTKELKVQQIPPMRLINRWRGFIGRFKRSRMQRMNGMRRSCAALSLTISSLHYHPTCFGCLEMENTK